MSAFLSTTVQAWADEESEVVHLTGENFDTELAKHESALVFMYAPWCGKYATLYQLGLDVEAALEKQ